MARTCRPLVLIWLVGLVTGLTFGQMLGWSRGYHAAEKMTLERTGASVGEWERAAQQVRKQIETTLRNPNGL